MQRRDAARRRTPKRLAFAEHVNRFVAGQGTPSRPERPKVLARLHPPLDGPVVLFDQLIEVTPHPMSAVFVQDTFGLEPLDRWRVSPMAIGVDHPRTRMVLSAQGFGQKAFSSLGVLFGREQKIQRR